ncbi:MAG: tetratricopeptide repeat protein [Alphaproteobacteria bacterium]
MPDDSSPISAAVALFQAGELAAAEKSCRDVLARQEGNAEAWHLLGVIAHRAGRNDIAVRHVRQAVALAGDSASFHNTLGYLLRLAGQYADSVAALEKAIALQPDYADAHNNLGIAHAESGALETAEAAYRTALRHRPDFPEVQNNLGNLMYRMGRVDESLAAFEAATTLRPDYAEAHSNRGDAYLNQGDIPAAIEAFDTSVKIAPNWPNGWYKLGNALFQGERFENALKAYQRSIDLNPNQMRCLTNLGATLEKLGRYEEAAMMLRHALVLMPEDVSAMKNLGHVVLKLGHTGEGLHLLRRVAELAPDDPDGHYSLGNALLRMERLQDALNCYKRVRELQPNAARAYFAPASVLLMNGQFKEGWAAYESRFDMAAYKTNVKNVRDRLWDGSPLNGRRLLVHVEQGFGDTLMFIRYVPLLRRFAGEGKIYLACEPELFRVLKTVEGVDEVYALGSEASVTFEVQVPLLSLPNRFGTTVETIPNRVPYLRPPPDAKTRIKRRKGGRLAVAFAWAGRPTHSDDRFRSCPLIWFAALFDIPGIDFYSIQWGPRSGELKPYLARGNVFSLSGQLTDFGETAAIIDQVDLVISIDSAVTHLAGALGKRVWTILPFGGEWRWLFRREDSPWYPNMRLYRQRILGDWRPVFLRIAGALQQLATAGKGAGDAVSDTAVGQHDTATEPGSVSSGEPAS